MSSLPDPQQNGAPAPAPTWQGETGALSSTDQSRNQALIDTTARITGAMYVYVSLWLVITLVSGLQRSHPVLVWGAAAWLGLLALVRGVVGHQLKSLLDYNPGLAHKLTVGLVLCNGLTWGLLTAASVYFPELEPIRTSMLLVGVGLSSGGTVAMAINPTLKVWFPVSVITPVALATASNMTQGNLMLAGLMMVYTVYIMHASRVVSQDYWRAQVAYKALEHASLTDTLTQIPNRLHFDRQYQAEWRRACRLGTRLAVMIVDLDHFKRINDEHGHPVGDAVLQEAANAMRQAIMRPCDVLARYGGEEFIVLLPDITEDGAHVVAERLRVQVANLKIAVPTRSTHVSVTCSLGYACTIPQHHHDADEPIRQADAALYRAKTEGRNRSRSWQAPSPLRTSPLTTT
ncbi:MAG: GGDEF domain-containing protein [Aquabacterium sp.]|uniref:GGDEF domain-containing protein n=1 Tax=Aquabacterium sp. TaxID=1872578 RepID=UPI0025C5268F|nr:GGDEF domain-containing protein [Aquabacterium sp.]MBI5925370.1 GGDEF domain-containing protein [Aquabacterium sp.]